MVARAEPPPLPRHQLFAISTCQRGDAELLRGRSDPAAAAKSMLQRVQICWGGGIESTRHADSSVVRAQRQAPAQAGL